MRSVTVYCSSSGSLEPHFSAGARELGLRNNGAQHLIERHTLPFQNGIPVRLFVRYLGKFSRDLDMIYSTDSDDILK
jgi:hypothetical protein